MNDKILTQTGFEALKKKYNALFKKRTHLMEELDETRGMGDLAENSSYHAIKSHLVLVDGQLAELKEMIDNSKVVSRSENGTTVGLGSKVKLAWEKGEKDLEVVGDGEADPLKGKVSFSSPLAQSLSGKKEGDEVEMETPGGVIKYRILSVVN